MKLVISVLVCVFLMTVSCKKYRLNQPSYLNFSWGFVNNSSNQSITITNGFFYLSKLNVNGVRSEGPEVEIEQSLPDAQISYQSGGSLGLSIDVPVGNYTHFDVALDVKEGAVPNMVLNGTYKSDTDTLPFRIEWSTAQVLDFISTNGFELKKKENYTLTLGIDVARLVSSVSSSQWSQATVTLENEIPTIVIRDGFNEGIFNDVNDEIENALYLTIQ